MTCNQDVQNLYQMNQILALRRPDLLTKIYILCTITNCCNKIGSVLLDFLFSKILERAIEDVPLHLQFLWGIWEFYQDLPQKFCVRGPTITFDDLWRGEFNLDFICEFFSLQQGINVFSKEKRKLIIKTKPTENFKGHRHFNNAYICLQAMPSFKLL